MGKNNEHNTKDLYSIKILGIVLIGDQEKEEKSNIQGNYFKRQWPSIYLRLLKDGYLHCEED